MSAPSSSHQDVRLAVVGMIEGNGHPWSWSAIVNGYDPAKLAACPFPVIPKYISAQPRAEVRIAGAQVTHLWTDRAEEAPPIAAAALIPRVLTRPEQAIGEVDGVLIATDDGSDHVRRARAFIEAGLPVFVDKPLATTLDELRTFVRWQASGARILSSSGLRYAPELDSLAELKARAGSLRWISAVSCKTWERYGIHLLEPVYRILGPGFDSVRLETRPGVEVAHITHRSGVDVSLPVIADGGGAFGAMHLCGTDGEAALKFNNTYVSFRRQLVSFVDFVRSGREPYPFSETVEMMAVLIAGIHSRSSGNRVAVSTILEQVHP